MQIEIDTVKGFQDYLPPESLKRQAVTEIIRKHFRLYGFLPVETPIVEFDELMKGDSVDAGNEDEAISERFRLKDRAGRNLGLRYEFTFQLARIFKLNPNIKLPFRRYQIGPVFRDEPTGAKRFRQFVQCDADIIGDSSLDSDIECLSMISDIMKELKISAEIHVNNRKLLASIIESVEINDSKEVMRELDKIGKLGEDAVKVNLRKYADGNQIVTLFKLLEKDLAFFTANAFDGADEIKELQSKCKKYNVKVKFSPFMIRGLGYYTGNVFEVKAAGQKETIAAGGRYDKIVGKYLNKEIPAIGISFGLERLSELAKITPGSTPKAIIISIGEETAMIKLSKTLRENNVSCMTTEEKVGKALEYANSYSIPYSIFIGEDEVEKEKFKLKDMKSGQEKNLSEKQLLRLLKK